MIELANVEQSFVDQLKAYAAVERSRVEALEKEIASIAEEVLSKENFTESTFNAKHGFGLLRRLHNAANKAQMFVQTLTTTQNLLSETIPTSESTLFSLPEWLRNHSHVLPTDEDLIGAQDAILRVQRIYNLTTDDLLPDEPYQVYLSLGKRAGEQTDWPRAMQWLESADARFNTSSPQSNWTAYALLHDHLAFAAYHCGEIHIALESSKKVIEHNPTNYRVQDNIEWYEYELARTDGVERVSSKWDPDNLLDSSEVDMQSYRELCRDVDKSTESVVLKCRTEASTQNPLLALRPSKVEDVLLDADTGASVRIFHDFLSDDESEHLKMVATNELKRSVASNGDGFKPAEYRISKVAWMKNNRTKTIETVNKRIAAVTGLDLTFAEDLQVSNYGIGGHYMPHHDSGVKTSYGKRGGRLATFMIYLSDVSDGGATVFPRIKIGVRPQKNVAVFWYNIDPETFESNQHMLHGGCPVVQGSKWVANKWIHEQGNEICLH